MFSFFCEFVMRVRWDKNTLGHSVYSNNMHTWNNYLESSHYVIAIGYVSPLALRSPPSSSRYNSPRYSVLFARHTTMQSRMLLMMQCDEPELSELLNRKRSKFCTHLSCVPVVVLLQRSVFLCHVFPSHSFQPYENSQCRCEAYTATIY